MKKDRNCNSPYPIYPPYQPMMGYMQPPYMMQEQNNQNLQQQINNLERRVSNLENMYNSNNVSYSNTNYNSSNYQMM
ncbi:MAG: hypothetical protein IJ134_02055 [Bacilli bacterium]|nr:hypothetical protein [Bacilli bacterium]